MVSLFDPLKFPIMYVNSPTPNTYSVFYTEGKFVQYWLVLAYLVAIAMLFVP